MSHLLKPFCHSANGPGRHRARKICPISAATLSFPPIPKPLRHLHTRYAPPKYHKTDKFSKIYTFMICGTTTSSEPQSTRNASAENASQSLAAGMVLILTGSNITTAIFLMPRVLTHSSACKLLNSLIFIP